MGAYFLPVCHVFDKFKITEQQHQVQQQRTKERQGVHYWPNELVTTQGQMTLISDSDF